jgi:outer membrane lipoprotein carrier protein
MASTAGAEPVAGAEPAAWQPLQRVLEKVGPVETYTADFTQQKFTPLLRDPIESEGRVRIVPGLARWDTLPPYASTLLVEGETLRMYYPEQETLEIYELGQRMEAMAASPAPRVEMLQEYFDLGGLEEDTEAGTITATLLPRRDDMKDALVEAIVSFDLERGVLQRLEMTDLDDETTVLVFRDVRLNPELDPASLRFEPPAGTRVVHPLEGADR